MKILKTLTLTNRALLGASLIAGLTVAALPVSAQLIAYDGFDYAAGNDLYSQNGGSGWGGAWLSRSEVLGGGSIVTNQAPIQAGSLSYSDGVNSLLTTGNHSRMFGAPGVSLELARNLGAPAGGADGTSIYMSFLIQRTGDAQSPATTSPPNEYPRGANMRWWTDGGERGNIGNNSNASTDTLKLTSKDVGIDSGVTFSGQVNFVVGRIDFDSVGGNMLHLWVNPSLSTEDLGAAMSVAYLDGATTFQVGCRLVGKCLVLGVHRVFLMGEPSGATAIFCRATGL